MFGTFGAWGQERRTWSEAGVDHDVRGESIACGHHARRESERGGAHTPRVPERCRCEREPRSGQWRCSTTKRRRRIEGPPQGGENPMEGGIEGPAPIGHGEDARPGSRRPITLQTRHPMCSARSLFSRDPQRDLSFVVVDMDVKSRCRWWCSRAQHDTEGKVRLLGCMRQILTSCHQISVHGAKTAPQNQLRRQHNAVNESAEDDSRLQITLLDAKLPSSTAIGQKHPCAGASCGRGQVCRPRPDQHRVEAAATAACGKSLPPRHFRTMGPLLGAHAGSMGRPWSGSRPPDTLLTITRERPEDGLSTRSKDRFSRLGKVFRLARVLWMHCRTWAVVTRRSFDKESTQWARTVYVG